MVEEIVIKCINKTNMPSKLTVTMVWFCSNFSRGEVSPLP